MGALRSTPFKIAGSCLALLDLLCCPGAAVAGSPTNVERCLAIAAGLNLGAAPARTRTKLRAGRPVTIVTLGSSSTSGFGTFGLGYPEVMKAELSRLHPSLHIDVINSGRLLDTMGGMLARLQTDVLKYKPDLVVWQLGTNDVVWRGIARDAKQLLRKGVERLKKANADVILMDLQDSPVVRSKPARATMEKLITTVASEAGVGLFPRYRLMQRAHSNGVEGLVAFDGLHNSGDGYLCIGQALARMINRGVGR
jgi:acyl-CoA thioesterase-1